MDIRFLLFAVRFHGHCTSFIFHTISFIFLAYIFSPKIYLFISRSLFLRSWTINKLPKYLTQADHWMSIRTYTKCCCLQIDFNFSVQSESEWDGHRYSEQANGIRCKSMRQKRSIIEKIKITKNLSDIFSMLYIWNVLCTITLRSHCSHMKYVLWVWVKCWSCNSQYTWIVLFVYTFLST